MSLKLMYITNQVEMATLAENSGVDWIFVDLEIVGKEERQGHLDTVISRHRLSDVKKIKEVLSRSQLIVRVNPIYENSEAEIDQVIHDGADIVMLPYFKSKEEVNLFVRYVNQRAKVCLLCETSEAVENIDSILTVEGIDYIHIGLNDLHLSYNMNFMFEPLAVGIVESLCNKMKKKGIQYGFGGIAQLGSGELPAESILTEHYRLGSSMVILSRSFYNNNHFASLERAEQIFIHEVKRIRDFENQLINKDESYFRDNLNFIKNKVTEIVYSRTN